MSVAIREAASATSRRLSSRHRLPPSSGSSKSSVRACELHQQFVSHNCGQNMPGEQLTAKEP